MNVLLWILQAVLAFLYVAGGAYKITSFDQLASQMPALARGGWRALGAVEVLGGLLLVFPAAMKLKPALTPLAGALLALETLALAAFYARYSTALTARNPMVWAVVMGVLVAAVAWGRYTYMSHA